MKKIILLSAFILTIAFGLCGCKKDDATVHFASETEQTAVVSSDVNRQTADSKEKKASSDGRRQKTQQMTLMNLLSGASISVVRLPIPVYTE